MQESQFPHTQYSYEPPEKPGGKKKWMLLLVILLLLGGGAYAANQYFNTTTDSESITPTPAPTEIVFPTDTPTPTASPSGSLTPTRSAVVTTPTKAAGSAIDKATGLDRSQLTVLVQNGSGIAGAGSKAATTLRNLGYNVTGTGNAESFDYETTVIQVKSSKAKYLDLLKKDLADVYTISASSSATLAITHDSDAVVIIGKK